MITVQFAVELPENHPLRRYAPPPGFPLVVHESTQKVIEPVFVYLYDRFIPRGGKKWNRNSANAAAYDLRSWFDYLENVEIGDGKFGKAWDLANEDDYANYREALQDVISERTHRPLANATIRRRQYHVEDLYIRAREAGIYQGEFLRSTLSKGRYRPADYIPLAHTISGEKTHTYSKYREEIGPSGHVRPLTSFEWDRIKDSLGPLPSERKPNDERPSRDRLASEISCSTGMRVDELANLTVNQALSLDASWRLLDDEMREDGYIKLVLTKTKRLVPRTILFPAYLVPELVMYIQEERESAIEAGKKHARSKGSVFANVKTLFVNSAEAGHNAGKRLRPASLSYAFHKACIDCGLVAFAINTNPDTGEEYNKKIALHSFHDLRHTFAVWRYERDKSRGEEPWKAIQALLGHASMKTTLDIYLAVTEVEKMYVGATVFRAKQRIGGNNV